MIKIFVGNVDLYEWACKSSMLRNFIAFDISRLSSIKDVNRYSRVIDGIRLNNGTYKSTSPNRFEDIDDYLIEQLKGIPNVIIHDLAVSDGITSLELHKKLLANEITHSMTVSDLYSKLYMVNDRLGWTLIDFEGNVVMRSALKVMANRSLSRRYLISRTLGHLVPLKVESKAKERNAIYLLNHEVKRLIDEKVFRFVDMDVFNPIKFEGRFDVVRMMNILNPLYFHPDQIMLALRKQFELLKDGGLLIVGRTLVTPTVNHATIYRKQNNSLVAIKTFNSGTELSVLIENTFA